MKTDLIGSWVGTERDADITYLRVKIGHRDVGGMAGVFKRTSNHLTISMGRILRPREPSPGEETEVGDYFLAIIDERADRPFLEGMIYYQGKLKPEEVVPHLRDFIFSDEMRQILDSLGLVPQSDLPPHVGGRSIKEVTRAIPVSGYAVTNWIRKGLIKGGIRSIPGRMPQYVIPHEEFKAVVSLYEETLEKGKRFTRLLKDRRRKEFLNQLFTQLDKPRRRRELEKSLEVPPEDLTSEEVHSLILLAKYHFARATGDFRAFQHLLTHWKSSLEPVVNAYFLSVPAEEKWKTVQSGLLLALDEIWDLRQPFQPRDAAREALIQTYGFLKFWILSLEDLKAQFGFDLGRPWEEILAGQELSPEEELTYRETLRELKEAREELLTPEEDGLLLKELGQGGTPLSSRAQEILNKLKRGIEERKTSAGLEEMEVLRVFAQKNPHQAAALRRHLETPMRQALHMLAGPGVFENPTWERLKEDHEGFVQPEIIVDTAIKNWISGGASDHLPDDEHASISGALQAILVQPLKGVVKAYHGIKGTDTATVASALVDVDKMREAAKISLNQVVEILGAVQSLPADMQKSGLEEGERPWMKWLDAQTRRAIRKYDRQTQGVMGEKINQLYERLEWGHLKEGGPRASIILSFGLPVVAEESSNLEEFQTNFTILEELAQTKKDWVFVEGIHVIRWTRQEISGRRFQMPAQAEPQAELEASRREQELKRHEEEEARRRKKAAAEKAELERQKAEAGRKRQREEEHQRREQERLAREQAAAQSQAEEERLETRIRNTIDALSKVEPPEPISAKIIALRLGVTPEEVRSAIQGDPELTQAFHRAAIQLNLRIARNTASDGTGLEETKELFDFGSPRAPLADAGGVSHVGLPYDRVQDGTEAERVVAETVKGLKTDGAWYVMSAQTLKKYPGLQALALQVPNIILDDEFGEAIVRLMEEPQPIGQIHFYYVARQELNRFLLFMEMEPPPLVLQEGWLIEHPFVEPYPSFQDFLKEILSPHLSEPKAASEGQGIDWNRLASALEILSGA